MQVIELFGGPLDGDVVSEHEWPLHVMSVTFTPSPSMMMAVGMPPGVSLMLHSPAVYTRSSTLRWRADYEVTD